MTATGSPPEQSVLTVVADVEAGGLDAVRHAVASIHEDPGANAVLPFSLFDNLHFASLVLAEQKSIKCPKLIFECNVDGTVEAWLATLAARAAPGLDVVFGASPGYPCGADAEARRAWLASHVVRPGAFHIGATGRSVQRIRQELALHEAIESFLDAEDRAGRISGASPESIRANVQAFVRADPALAWAQDPAGPRQSAMQRGRHLAKAAVSVVMFLLLLPVLLPILLVALAVLLVKERVDSVQKGPAPPDYVSGVEEHEDQLLVAQNHLSSVIPVKPGILRAVLLRVVLYVVNQVARVTCTKGELGGIPSIHFAHWSRIDDGHHLLFVSNFDGSWESYLGDFIDKAAKGLTSVWSNTVDFPRTTLLAFKGRWTVRDSANGPGPANAAPVRGTPHTRTRR